MSDPVTPVVKNADIVINKGGVLYRTYSFKPSKQTELATATSDIAALKTAVGNNATNLGSRVDSLETAINGNGSDVMRRTAAQQVQELSRKIDDNEVELIIGIDEDSLGGFSSQVFVRTAVVLHGNITSGPLMAIPNKMAWDKDVTNYRVSDRVKTAYMLPRGMTQHEKVNGFGANSQMLDNIFEKQINHVIDDFYDRLDDLMMSIDYSKYITGG